MTQKKHPLLFPLLGSISSQPPVDSLLRTSILFSFEGVASRDRVITHTDDKNGLSGLFHQAHYLPSIPNRSPLDTWGTQIFSASPKPQAECNALRQDLHKETENAKDRGVNREMFHHEG